MTMEYRSKILTMIATALMIVPISGAVRESSCSVILAILFDNAMIPSPTERYASVCIK